MAGDIIFQNLPLLLLVLDNIYIYVIVITIMLKYFPWGTGRCDSRPGLVLSIVERSSFVIINK